MPPSSSGPAVGFAKVSALRALLFVTLTPPAVFAEKLDVPFPLHGLNVTAFTAGSVPPYKRVQAPVVAVTPASLMMPGAVIPDVITTAGDRFCPNHWCVDLLPR